MGEVLNHGGPGYLQFAITNICNAKCDFCGFAVDRFDPKKASSVTLQEARDVIDISVKNHIGYLLFVGGEPLVHKDLRAMTRYAAERGIHPNGLHQWLALDGPEHARAGKRRLEQRDHVD
jgi:MoaA/NifB/PqqE/SkfB family radical SAM enzyme